MTCDRPDCPGCSKCDRYVKAEELLLARAAKVTELWKPVPTLLDRAMEALRTARGYVAATEASLTWRPNIVTADLGLVDAVLAEYDARGRK